MSAKPPPRVGQRLGDAGFAFEGRPQAPWSDAYHRLLIMPMWALLAFMLAGYLGMNALFAGLYMLDPGGIVGARPGDFLDHFFFSVQTLDTLGYGVMAPRSRYANALVTAESFVGLFNLGIATGVIFARISRPSAQIMFTRRAVVTAFEGAPTLMLRAANRRRNLVLEADVSLTLVQDVVTKEGVSVRRFQELAPLRGRSPLFALTWQIMHAIDEGSPLKGHTRASLEAVNAEILVVIRGLDETFVSTIHARTSYLPHEIEFGARLADIFSRDADGRRRIDFTRFDEIE